MIQISLSLAENMPHTHPHPGRHERQRRVRAHAHRGRKVPLLPAARMLLPRAGGGVLPPHLARAGPGACLYVCACARAVSPSSTFLSLLSWRRHSCCWLLLDVSLVPFCFVFTLRFPSLPMFYDIFLFGEAAKGCSFPSRVPTLTHCGVRQC